MRRTFHGASNTACHAGQQVASRCVCCVGCARQTNGRLPHCPTPWLRPHHQATPLCMLMSSLYVPPGKHVRSPSWQLSDYSSHCPWIHCCQTHSQTFIFTLSILFFTHKIMLHKAATCGPFCQALQGCTRLALLRKPAWLGCLALTVSHTARGPEHSVPTGPGQSWGKSPLGNDPQNVQDQTVLNQDRACMYSVWCDLQPSSCLLDWGVCLHH